MIWKEVDKETFERFVQIAYTGDYSIPKPEDRVRSCSGSLKTWSSPPHSIILDTRNESGGRSVAGNIKLPEPEPVEDDWGSVSARKKKKKGRIYDISPVPTDFEYAASHPLHMSPPVPMTSLYPAVSPIQRIATDFRSLEYPLLAPRNSYNDSCEPDANFNTSQSYSKVLLAHASLYILGDYQLIDSLKMLALHKLHRTLCNFHLNSYNMADIVDLARYAYTEEGKGTEEGIGELRSMVCHYMAINSVELSSDAAFMELLGEGGQFVKDFFKFEVQRAH